MYFSSRLTTGLVFAVVLAIALWTFGVPNVQAKTPQYGYGCGCCVQKPVVPQSCRAARPMCCKSAPVAVERAKPVPEPEPAPVVTPTPEPMPAPPAPVTEAPKELPKTASPMGLIGLLGLLSITGYFTQFFRR